VVERYESRGFQVLAAAYPGLEVEVEALRDDPSPIEALTVPGTVEHLEGVIRELERPPIVLGGRSHYTVGQDGWEEVADYALDWAKENAVRADLAEPGS
jgi:hypothetical protein